VRNLESIACRLVEAKVEFVLCGGLAALLQGSSILTRDVDVVCDMSNENISRLHDAIKDLHPFHRMTPQRIPFTSDQINLQTFQNIYLSTDWGQLDCLGDVKGIGGFLECLKMSEPIEMAGFTMRTLTLDGILIAKRAMGRPRDLQAVFELEAARERKNNSF
jgi:hypothetical protein